MPRHSDFLECCVLEEDSHLFQRLDTIRFEITTPGVEKQSFSNHDGEMIAGLLHPDVTIAQCCVKHTLQFILHLTQTLLRTVCATDHHSQAHQDTGQECYDLSLHLGLARAVVDHRFEGRTGVL